MSEVNKYLKWKLSINIKKVSVILLVLILFLGNILESSNELFWLYFFMSWFLLLSIFVLIPIYQNIYIIKSIKKKKDIVIYVLSIGFLQTLLHKLLTESLLSKYVNLETISNDRIEILLSRYMYDFEFGLLLILITFVLFFATFKFKLKLTNIRDRFKKEYMRHKNSIKQDKENKYGVVIPDEK